MSSILQIKDYRRKLQSSGSSNIWQADIASILRPWVDGPVLPTIVSFFVPEALQDYNSAKLQYIHETAVRICRGQDEALSSGCSAGMWTFA
jgi:hypothetical protein